ncbi:hypothetical protein [Peribacillus simplex]|uniref:hypothetical protein n=1 Tax=Peribacillus TaxID=2675229 RepID=UPI00366D2E92
MKKKILFGLSTCLLAVGIAGGVSAAGSWSGEYTLDLPGSGGNVYGASKGVPYKKKVSSDARAAFYGIAKTSSLSSYGTVVNSDKVVRSGTTTVAAGYKFTTSTTASNGYSYNVRLNADTWQVGTDSVRFKWSPDNP